MAGELVLVVDDGRENREFVVEYVLEPNGYQALMARDGREGLEMALEHKPDLILLDFQMPRMNGAEMLGAMSEHGLSIPVILMTFHGSEEVVMQVYKLGVRDYIKKPFSVDEMLISIERSLTEVRLQQEKEALTERVIQANRDLQRRVQELNVLYGVGRSVTTMLDMDQLLPRIVDAAIQMTQSEQGYLYLLNTKDNLLYCRAMHLRTAKQAQATNEMNIDNPVAIHVVKTGQPILLTPQQLASKNPKGLVSAAYAPLMLADRIVGVLGVENLSNGAHVFTKHDSALLSALTDYATIAIENSRNYEELRRTKDDEKAHIRDKFERFVPPSVVDRALRETDVQPGGYRREISVLFADIRGYTAWSENAPPEDIVAMLNDYLSLAAEIIMSWEGTLDKFFGDGLMAIFNAPEDQPDHVHRAADAALALLRAADEIGKWRGYNLSYSVGVHVGEAVVGYIGTPRAMNYTAIGDVVNVAKRLQEVAAPGQIMIDEAVLQRLGNLAQTRPLGSFPLRGRKKQVIAYELTGLQYPDR